MPGSLDPPGAASAVLSAFWQPFERYGWTVLLTLLALFLAWRYFHAWQQRRRTVDPVHAEQVIERARAARLAQQAAWTAVAPTAHRQTEELRQRIHNAAPAPTSASATTAPTAAAAASASEERLSYEEVFGCELDEDFYRKRKEKKYKSGSLYSTSNDDDSAPSRPTSSSSSSSGFKPYTKPAPGGGGRRFGGGPSKRGG